MINTLLRAIAPHYCSSCGEIGSILCTNCKYDIVSEPYGRCINCEMITQNDALCGICDVAYARAWCVGERVAVLRDVMDGFKFERAAAAGDTLAELLDTIVPACPAVIVVPVPTITRHIRQRGYDHAYVLAKRFAKKRNLPVRRCLVRRTDYQQRGASKRQRRMQAAAAFAVQNVTEGATYLLIDDIVTTGATVHYAAQALRDAGAREVWVAVVARQPSTTTS